MLHQDSSPHSPYAWACAVLLFGVGDLATTVLGLSAGAVELHPVVATVTGSATGVRQLVPLLGVWKAAVIAAFYAAFAVVDPPFRIGIPVGLTLLGGAVVAWNLSVLLALA